MSRGLPDEGRELRGGWRLLLGRFDARGGSGDRLESLAAFGLALGRPRFGAELLGAEPVSYTHLTLPTNREV